MGEKKILALVDDVMVSSRIVTTLGAGGYDVRIAPVVTGADAVREWEPDGIVVSFGAPAREWERAIRTIRADPALAGTPLLAFGPHVDTDGRAAATAAGATRVVTNGAFFNRMPEMIAALVGGTDAVRG